MNSSEVGRCMSAKHLLALATVAIAMVAPTATAAAKPDGGPNPTHCQSAREGAAGSNFSGFCEPGIDALVERALAEQGSDPRLANRLWERVDRALVRAAPAIPMFNRRSVVLVSERVGNVQWHPVSGVLPDQLWIR
jgi:ABC-type transport system substrate-binding protein